MDMYELHNFSKAVELALQGVVEYERTLMQMKKNIEHAQKIVEGCK